MKNKIDVLHLIATSSIVVYSLLFYSFSFNENTLVNKQLWIDGFINYLTATSLNENESNLNFPVQQTQNENNFVQQNNELISNDILKSIKNDDQSLAFDDTSKGRQRTEEIFDTLSNLSNIDTNEVSDSTQLNDSIKVNKYAIDSTARIQQFKYKPKDHPYITLYNPKPSSFFAQPSSNLKRRVIEIDSTGKFVEVKEMIGNQVNKIILRLTLEEYLKARLDAREREMWESLGYEYTLKDTALKELSQLISDITELEIPLPQVGFLSIFGPPRINLKIGGAVDIHGAWRSETTEGLTISGLGNTRNEPDFRQQVQINVNGTIGDKLQINADWNTERTFEYENQLKLKYTGYEDEIVQSVEAGNVSLQTSPLVGGGEALFGIKALFKMGPFTLTTIASQKKGEIKEKTITNGATSQGFIKRVYEYSKNHYFLDAIYADTSEQFNFFYKYCSTQVEPTSYYKISDIEVYKSVRNFNIDLANEYSGVAIINLDPKPAGGYPDSLRNLVSSSGLRENERFIKLQENVDYIVHRETGYITLTATPNDDEAIAVAYRIQGDNSLSPNDDIVYGDFSTEKTDSISIFKLIKPKYLQPNFADAWKLQLKNIYSIGGRDINEEGFEFDIKYEVPGQDPQSVLGNVQLLNAFGLDLTGPSGSSTQPDGLFDFRRGITIIPETGDIIFPHLQPFGRNLPASLSDYAPLDSLRFNEIYDTTDVAARYVKIKDKFILTGKYSGTSSANFPLGFNLVENSVKVYLNNRELTLNIDYIVDYTIGQLTIKNPDALIPGANLRITYEENDLFQLASKSLLGARGEFDISKNTKFGFSALNLSQQSLNEKVRLGEEPISNSIFGFDFSTGGNLPFLTQALDKIFSTRTMSSFTFKTEAAYMNPDPNTRKSKIGTDQNKSIAYIDDFEGTKRIIPIGISYSSWHDISLPNNFYNYNGLNGSGVTDSALMSYKSKSIWYNILPTNVNVNEIWPNKRVATENQNITVLDYVYYPDRRGSYNYNPNFDTLRHNWGGMMKLLSSTANDLIYENIEFIEFWLKIEDETPSDAKMYIDLGQISEDVIPNGKLDTEDKNRNNTIDNADEDTGLDGMFDAQEQSLLPVGKTESDPGGDNFSFNRPGSTNPEDYLYINGTQGNNVLAEVGRIPDTEDLNNNGSLNTTNSYFRYEVPLNPDSTINPYVSGGGNFGWYLYRIPLKEFKEKVGDPSLSVVQMIRLFTTNVDAPVHFRLTEFNLVGNQWVKQNRDDSILTVSVVNVEDNPNYTSPVKQEKDRTRPDQNILLNEQSLNLILKDLPYDSSRQVIKDLYRSLDVFNYKEMKLFIHPDEGTEGLDFSFKFGIDTLNYYEFRKRITRNYATVEGWIDASIVFSELTAIKQKRDSANYVFADSIYLENGDSYIYAIRGNPSLTNIKFLSFTLINQKDSTLKQPISGEVWINELRVIGADDSPGWAYNFSGSIKFADIGNFNFNYSKTDPYFHTLSNRFGSRNDQTNWGVAADIDVLRILPFRLENSNLRISYQHNESTGNPLYLPGTDIKIDEAAVATRGKTAQQVKMEAQSYSVSDSYSASGIKFGIPIDYWLVRDSFNRLTFNFNYNKTFSRNPTVERNDYWIWNTTIDYALPISPNYNFYFTKIPILGKPLSIFKDYRNLKIYYLPQNFNWNVGLRRSKTSTINRPINNRVIDPIVSRDFSASRGMNFNWKMSENGFFNITTTYNLSVSSSLSHLETDANKIERSESEIWNDIFGGVWFGRDFAYNQTLDIRTAPKLPSIWNLSRYFTLTFGYNVRYQWNNNFTQIELGRSAGNNKQITVGLTLKLKSLMEPVFKETKKPQTKSTSNNQTSTRNRDFTQNQQKTQIQDTSKTSSDTSNIKQVTKEDDGPSTLLNALLFLKTITRILLFDYETINIDFSNNTSYAGGALRNRGTGFYNFWGLTYSEGNGPSRAFMLGLSRDLGPRAINANFTDNFSERNNLNLKTSRPLWEGARISLNWKVGWSINKQTSFTTDEFGNAFISNITSTSSIDRSFISFPPVLIFSSFGNGIKKVAELYDRNASDPYENISNAFLEGFETFPLLSKIPILSDYARYIPRANWNITWDGLEKLPLFKSFAKRVSLDHSYNSNYTEGWKIDPLGKKIIQTQRVSYGFAPLVGLNLTFTQLWGGNLSGNIKYSIKNNFDLAVVSRSITESFSRDIGFTITFNKTGFEIPLFGVSLKNDIDISIAYTNSQIQSTLFDMNNFNEEGTPQDGTTRTSLEPRVKYVMSSRVTMSIYYRRSSVEPKGVSRIPPSTINEAGLDIKITIQ